MNKILYAFKPFEWLYVFISLTTFLVFGIISYKSSIDILIIISVLMGFLASCLNIKTKRIAFVFYFIYAFIYGIVSLILNNYGEGVLNIVYALPLYLYTIYKLYFKKNKETITKINHLKVRMYILCVFIIIIVTIGYGFILKALKSNYPFLNALATSTCIIASFLASKRYLDQWVFYMLYALSLIVLWLLNYLNYQSSGILYLILNIFYMFNNIYGFLLYFKLLKHQQNN